MIHSGWESAAVGEIAAVRTGPFGSALHESDYRRVGTPIVTVEHLGDRGLVHRNLPLVGDEDAKRLSAYVCRTGDILFSRVGSVDRNSLVSSREEGWLYSGRLLRLRVDPRRVHAPFLSYLFSTTRFKASVRSVAVGQTMPSLNTKIVKSLIVSIPDVATQREIARRLAAIDNLIAALEQLVAKKQEIKQGMMLQLLTGRTRLAGFQKPWERHRLGELLTYEQPGPYLVSSTDYSTSGTPVLTAGKTFVLGYTSEQNGVYRAVPVIIFDDFTTASKYVDFQFKAKSSAMKMLSAVPGVSLRYVYERMQLIDFVAVDHKRRWIGEYSKIEVDVPSPDEQAAIASVLSDADDELTLLRQKLDKANHIKQGMMQQLLSGRVRLPVESAL